MRIKSLVVGLFFTTLFINAQEALKVTYSKQTIFDIDGISIGGNAHSSINQKEMEAALKAAMEEKHQYHLTIKGNEANWQYQEKINNDLPAEGGFRISFGSGSGTIEYYNTESLNHLKEINAWQQEYLITDSLETFDWQITREKKNILGYPVRKAMATKDSVEYTAWFTPKIPIKSGPEAIWGLPGLILEVESKSQKKNNKTTFLQAFNIEVLEEENPIEVPSKGKKVTYEEFNAEQKQMMEKFKEMYGEGVDTDD